MIDKKIVAIITARGGSKGLFRKNVLDLNGKPLIAHTIEAAKESQIFDKIIVTTEDKEIKEVSFEFGAEVIDRPVELATDLASSIDVLVHALQVLESENFTHYILLQPTSPLRNYMHIKEAWNKYLKDKVNSLLGVCEVEHTPFKMLIEKDNGEVKPLTKWEHLTMPRQKLPDAYLPNGAIYINRVDKFLENQNLFEKPLAIYLMDRESSLDIDSEKDFLEVEKIMKR